MGGGWGVWGPEFLEMKGVRFKMGFLTPANYGKTR